MKNKQMHNYVHFCIFDSHELLCNSVIICTMLTMSSRCFLFLLKYYVILFGMNHLNQHTPGEFSQPSILITRNVLREIWPSQCERLLYKKNNNEGRIYRT